MSATNYKYDRPNILVVTHLYPNVITSFLGSFVAQQLQRLKARFNIVVLTTHHVPLTGRRTLRQSPYQFRDGIHVHSLPHAAYWFFALPHFRNLVLADKLLTARKIGKLARKLHLRYSFSLVHGHETYVGDEAAWIGRMLQIPSVFTLHGLYSSHLQSFGEAVLRRAVANMNATDRLIAVSRLSAESYREQGVHRDFDIIPNGTELRPSGSHPKAPEHMMTFTCGKFVLLTIGFFSPEKRIEQSIRTLARLHQNGITNTVLVIIGKGRLETHLRKSIEHQKLAHAVKIIGEVAPEDMPGYYCLADVLVHPSIVESFSMVCLEAMSYGKPIICTSSIGLVEYLQPGRDAVVIPPDDPEALYQAVLGLIRDPLRRHMLGQQAQRTAKSLSWANQVQKIERVYEEVLSK